MNLYQNFEKIKKIIRTFFAELYAIGHLQTWIRPNITRTNLQKPQIKYTT